VQALAEIVPALEVRFAVEYFGSVELRATVENSRTKGFLCNLVGSSLISV
jgi:hypothetical protein